MKIGDEVYIHGYVDEIRYDSTKRISTIIIRNEGGYFGTVESEIKSHDLEREYEKNKALFSKVVKDNDAISRQAVLDAFGLSEKTRKYGGDHSGYDTLMKYEIQDVLENLPPVTPQPKTGHRVFCENLTTYWKEVYKCSECNEEITKTGCWNHHSELEKYCPNCGAKMQ